MIRTILVSYSLLSLQGELRGVRGLVPSNFLEDLSDPHEETHQEPTQPLEEVPSQEPEGVPSPSENLLDEVILEDGEFEDPRESDNYQLPPRRMVALFDYDPQTLSPNPDSEVRAAVDQDVVSSYTLSIIPQAGWEKMVGLRVL